MQFITRMLIVLGVLGGLGYGSYAFGKYVLSARLFGPQRTHSTSATTGTLQAPPQVDVEVLPSPQATDNGNDSEVAAPTRAPQPAATPDARSEFTPDNSSTDNSRANDNSNNSDNTPRERPTKRPRRKRRVRPTRRPGQSERATAPAPQAQTPPTRTENLAPPSRSDANNDGNGNANSDAGNNNASNDTPRNDAPRVDIPRPRDNASDPTPPRRRERERRTAPDVQPRADAPRVPTRRRESSPVPMPEGAQGDRSESPVPMPG